MSDISTIIDGPDLEKTRMLLIAAILEKGPIPLVIVDNDTSCALNALGFAEVNGKWMFMDYDDIKNGTPKVIAYPTSEWERIDLAYGITVINHISQN